MRRSKVTGLLWSQVDLTRRTPWIHADRAKARKAIAVPLSAAELGSCECVEMVRKYAHLASDHLVQYVDRMSGLRAVEDGKVATFPDR